MTRSVALAAIFAALAPAHIAFACTTGGGELPATIPEAPWQPLLLVAGAASILVWRRRRSRGADVSEAAAPRRGLSRLAMLIARVSAVVLFTGGAVGVTSAAVSLTTPQQASAATACSSNNPDPISGGIQSASVTTPSVGAGLALQLTVPLIAGGIALVGCSAALRPRRRS